MIKTYKEFEEKLESLKGKEETFEVECPKCHKVYNVKKPYGTNSYGNKAYYLIRKNKDLTCFHCLNGGKTYSDWYHGLSDEERKKINAKRGAVRTAKLREKEKVESQIIYNTFDELVNAYNNVAHGGSFKCQDCGNIVIMKDRRALKHYINAHKDKRDLRCRGCSITHTKIQKGLIKPNNIVEMSFGCPRCKSVFKEKVYTDRENIIGCPVCSQEVGTLKFS